MKRRFDDGYSLVEVLIAIAVLGMLVVPTCTSLLTAVRVNAATEDMRQAQLSVSSAVEILMAEGISTAEDYEKRFPDVTVTVEEGDTQNYFRVRVAYRDEVLQSVYVDTYIPAASVRNPEGEGTK